MQKKGRIKVEQGEKGREAVPLNMSAFLFDLKENFKVQLLVRVRSVCWSVGAVFSPLLCFLTHLMFELTGLNDRTASERRPQALLSQGFKGPATRLLSAVRREMGTCGGEITCAGQSPQSHASLTGLLTGTRQGKSPYRQRDHGRRNLPLSPGHQGLEPGLL